MIILLDTSTPECRLSFVDADTVIDLSWHADRELASCLLTYIDDQLRAHTYDWSDISGIGVLRGPGSFTGLRIGITVMNTIADSLAVPIVGATGASWRDEVIERLQKGDNDTIVMPFYGSEAHITTQRK